MKLLLIITLLKSLAERMASFVLPLWAFQITQSNELMSNVRLFEYLPFLILGFVIGTLIDRIGSRKGFIIGTAGQILVMVILAYYGVELQRLLYVLVFIMMGMTYFANNSLIVQSKLVIPDYKLITFNKYNNMISNFVESAGPAVIGTILVLLTYSGALHFSYILLIIALIFSMLCFHPSQKGNSQPFIPDIINGFKVLYSLRNLWILSWWTAYANSIVVVTEVFVIYYAKSTLHLSDFKVGLLFASGGFGALLGSWLSERVEQRFGVIRVLVYSIPLIGLLYIFVSTHLNIFTLGLMLFFESLLFSLYIVCVRTYRLIVSPVRDLGKITGITSSIFKMFMPITLALYAFFGNSITANELLSILSTAFCLGSMLLALSRSLKMKEKFSDSY